MPIIKNLARRIFFAGQYVLLLLSYNICSLARVNKNAKTWVVGPDEIASVLKNFAEAIPDSVSVCLWQNPFYDFEYDFAIKSRSKVVRSLVGPLLFGYLSAKYSKFIYIGGNGFLLHTTDGRDNEFRFLNKRGKHIVCYFAGSEIRSHKLMAEYSLENEIDMITTYQTISNPGIDSEWNENLRQKLANSAEKYADEIFNPAVDQMSYFTRKTHSCMYFCSDDLYCRNDEKFSDGKKIKIVHAPSSPAIKGTPLVRSAIKKLKVEGYDFDYVELIGVTNDVVLRELRDAHIVLNQFYAYIPSIFGVEALAAHTAMMTSADEHIEKSLEKGSNKAWCVTPYWLIYDHLKAFLDNPDSIKAQADKGFDWCVSEYSKAAGFAKLKKIIKLDD
jgi:hypothetical protein